MATHEDQDYVQTTATANHERAESLPRSRSPDFQLVKCPPVDLNQVPRFKRMLNQWLGCKAVVCVSIAEQFTFWLFTSTPFLPYQRSMMVIQRKAVGSYSSGNCTCLHGWRTHRSRQSGDNAGSAQGEGDHLGFRHPGEGRRAGLWFRAISIHVP